MLITPFVVQMNQLSRTWDGTIRRCLVEMSVSESAKKKTTGTQENHRFYIGKYSGFSIDFNIAEKTKKNMFYPAWMFPGVSRGFSNGLP